MRSLLAVLVCTALTLGGCAWWEKLKVRSQSPDDEPWQDQPATLVGDLAVPFGMFPVEVESVGLVTGLRGTGSDPQPSQYRQALVAEMQARGVKNPNTVLASPDTALVLVRGVLRPGIQKDDHFDLEVRVLPRDETTSLAGGWLLPCELRELAVLGNQIRSGHPLGRASGPVMIDPASQSGQDLIKKTRGRILGGGVALKSRPLGLVLKPDHQSAINSARVETAVNRRFYGTYKGTKVGMAKAKTDKYIELNVHPKYKDNVERYVQVARSVALRESELERQTRLALLEKQLLDPISSSQAALQLEAIGTAGVDVLRKGLAANDIEVRFRSAEALAYLDQSEAAETLAQVARDEPAFRVFALAALSALDDLSSAERLRELLDSPSAETRYGAFRALTAMDRGDPAVAGETLGGQFSYHVLDTSGPPMVHVTRSRRPEIVLFGRDQRLATPLVLEAGNQIMVKADVPDQVAVSRFAVGQPDQRRIVSNRLDDVIRAIVELGGTYPDVVQALQAAKTKGALASRFEVDALPEAGRTYDRVAGRRPSAEGSGSDPDSQPGTGAEKTPVAGNGRHPFRAFFAKMTGRQASDADAGAKD